MRINTTLIPAILGVSPYQSREDAVRQLVRAHHGAASEFQSNAASEYTLRNTGTAIATLELEHGQDIHESVPIEYEDWARSSAQYETVTGEPIILRIPMRGGIKPLVQIPHVYARAQFEMVVRGKDKALVYQWTPEGGHLDVVPVDKEWQAVAMPDIRQFHAFAMSERDNPEHVAPARVEINTQEACLLVAEYDEMKEARDRADERMKEIMSRLTDITGGKNGLIDGRKLTKVEKAGAISYAKAVTVLAPKADLEQWRGSPSVSWRLT